MPTLAMPKFTVHERKPIRGSLVWWLRFLGVAAFLVILAVRLPASKDVHLAQIDLRWLGWCMLLTICQLLLEAFVWQWLLSRQRIRYAYPKTLVAHLASQYLGLVTPGHVGELLAAGYISMDTGITFGYALSSVVMKKILYWITVVGFGMWGLPLLVTVPFLQGVTQVAWMTAGIVLVFAAGMSVWVLSLRRIARKWQKLSPWQIDMTEFWSGIRQLVSPGLVAPLVVAGVSFSLLFLQLDAVLRAMGLVMPWLVVAKIMALSRIAARVIPISVVGFGSKDAAVIVLFAQQGVAWEAGLTATLLFLVCSYLVTLLLAGLCWWIKPLIVRRVRSAS